MAKAIEVVRCSSAAGFLDMLHPIRGKWPRHRKWVFRGHGDSRWKLLPSALRSESWTKGFAIPHDHPMSDDFQFQEQIALLRFYHLLDRAGMPVPRAEELIKLEPTHFGTHAPWPDPVLIPLMALAQHNGVPTSLLDWTRSPKVAAYFAAADALAKASDDSDALDVWALDSLFVALLGEQQEPLQCSIVRTLRHGNPNLHAQSGVFTLCRGQHRGHNGDLIPLDVLLEEIARAAGNPDQLMPCLRRIQLPTSEAAELLEELSLDQIDALTLFPGYAGIVRALKEQRWSVPIPE